MSSVRLTQYSHGAGCGCKISPKVLSEILSRVPPQLRDPRLMVGYDSRDDAAVYRLDDERAIVSTTDFFMPIVDDPFDFGAIASVNAISDIYAMAARPLVALAILGWPLDKLDPAIAGDVLVGARDACSRAGIALAGGHSIDAPEPIFGLAVTGIVHPRRIRSNDLARPGDELYLTKPLGVGILTTAQKRGLLADPDFAAVRGLMLELNDFGAELADVDAVRSITDVTGFGLLGHLLEMCEASGVCAEIDLARVPQLDALPRYVALRTFPGGTARNFDSYGHKVGPLSEDARHVLCDPQTSGGLLIAVDPERRDDFLRAATKRGMRLAPFGTLTGSGSHRVTVR
ncbi:MAG TPA: selenide, water dikinase SelD [Gammaproteobacteria bacterium]|jgi:selenide,water dikinase|nr:selenide, water dikinase SelD [Gammaproteobacteria bacterium]